MACMAVHVARFAVHMRRMMGPTRVLHTSQIIRAILSRAATFLPGLQPYLEQASSVGLDGGKRGSGMLDVRVGPRPYATGGLPIIGAVPGSPGAVHQVLSGW
jgi:glycine/D-amino acid oxidase-like deaminating enzyme